MLLRNSILFLLLIILELSPTVLPEEEEGEVIDLQTLLRNVASSYKTFTADQKAQNERSETIAKDWKELKLLLLEDRKTLKDFLVVPDSCCTCKQTSLRLPRDCWDLFQAGETKNGVYRIFPIGFAYSESFDVFCDMLTDGGGWTVIQRRGQFGQPVDLFYKTWDEYKHGFGDLQKEFWLGNEKLSTMTVTGKYELRVDFWDISRRNAFAKYKTFLVENESHQYQLHVGGYSGTAGESLDFHNRMKFTTRDRDNDASPDKNCAQEFSGAWWFNDCVNSHLNGLNKNGDTEGFRDGIVWNSFKGRSFSIPYVEMKIRPKNISN